MSSILNRIGADTLRRVVIVGLVAVFVCTAVVPVSFARAPRFEETEHRGDGDDVGGMAVPSIVKAGNESLGAPPIASVDVSMSLLRFATWLVDLETVLFIRMR